jgi:hypothetical protein
MEILIRVVRIVTKGDSSGIGRSVIFASLLTLTICVVAVQAQDADDVSDKTTSTLVVPDSSHVCHGQSVL